MKQNQKKTAFIPLLIFLVTMSSTSAFAHCDTPEGPVIKEAHVALERGDITPLLKWVTKEDERKLIAAFQRVQAKKQTPAQFLETFVRIHREGEGAIFTGVKPAGTFLPPAIIAADKAVETGSSKDLIDLLGKKLLARLREKFQKVQTLHNHVNDSVSAGRAYVAAYIEYVHFVEAVSELLDHGGSPHAPPSQGTSKGSCGGGCAPHAHKETP